MGDLIGNILGPSATPGAGMSMPMSNPGTEGPPGGYIVGALSGGNTPQARGQGLGPNTPFVPYSTGPGLTWNQGDPYAASRGQNQGMDLTGGGFGENWYTATAGQMMAPGPSQQYWNNVASKGPTMPLGSNYSEQEYLGFNRPNIANDPGLNPYYDRAKQNAANSINNQFGARGMFNSSAAMGQIGDAMSSLGAEQANREADYALRRLGEQRAWEGLGGQLAGQADAMSRANSQNELGWLTGLGNIANAADMAGQNRLTQGMNSAALAQQLREGRIGDFFNRTAMIPQMMAPMAMGTYNQMIGQDLGLMDQAINMALGLGGEARNQDYRTQERIWSDAERGAGLFGNVLGGIFGGK